MSQGAILDQQSQRTVLLWAVERKVALAASVPTDGQWCNLRSQLRRYDEKQDVIQITYPIPAARETMPEIMAGQQLGISFRRGHKKCVFVSPVVMRCTDTEAGGDPVDALVLRAPERIRELQRRAYQRVHVPSDRFIAIKLWQGGMPAEGEVSWPLCAGRLGNASVGGLLVDIRAEHNPRLGVGDLVGVEIVPAPGRPSLMAEAQYRHCTSTDPDRIGLGLQFVGLEHDVPGRASITQIAEFVRNLQHSITRGGRPRR